MIEYFARVVNGVVVETMVTKDVIKAKGMPLAWYIPCVVEELPKLDETQYVTQQTEVIDDEVCISYTLHDKPIEELIGIVSGKYNTVKSKAYRGKEATQTILDRVNAHYEARLQESLNKLAQERGYDNIVSLCSYIGSRVALRQAEAQYAIDLRDAVWNSYYEYMLKVNQKKLPYPTSIAEVEENITKINWDAFKAPA